MDEPLRGALEADIRMTHQRFCAAMERRLPALDAETAERYFGVLSRLVLKLEDDAKSLGEVIQEMVGEVGGLLLREAQRG